MPIRVIVAFTVATFILFVISLFFKKFRKDKVICIVLFTSFIAFTAYYISFEINILPAENLDKRDAVLTGTLCELPQESYGKYYYIIETDSIDIENVQQKMKVRMSASNALDIDVYDKIECKVHFFSSSNEEKGLDSQAYYNSKGIYARGFIYEYENININKIPNNQKPKYFHALKIRKSIISAIRIILPEDCASLICGVLLSDKQGMSENIKNDFRTIGVSHILSVSGLHVSIIGQFLLSIFLLLKFPRKLSAILSCFGIGFFMLITGFLPSVVRAGIMCILYFISLVFDRESDSLNSLGLAVLIITIANPLAAGDIGLLLSFTSTLGLIILNPKIFNILKSKTEGINFIPKRLLNSINSTLSTTISAMLFTTPLSLMVFGEISIISIVSNLLIIMPSTIMIVSSIISLLFYFSGILNFLSYPFAMISGVIAKYILSCSNFLANIPFASVSAMQEYVLIWVSATLILIAFALFFNLGFRNIKAISLLSLIILLSGITSYQFADSYVTKLAVLQTGNGSSIVLTRMGRAAVITCGGNSLTQKNIDNFLRYSGVKHIDYLLISDVNKKVSSVADNIIDNYEPLIIALNSSAELDDKTSISLENQQNVCVFKDKATCNLWDNTSLDVYTDSNQPFIKLLLNDLDILISPLGGDIENEELFSFNYDFFIASKLPNNFNKIATDYTILSMDEDSSKRDLSIIGNITNKAISVADQGNIIIESYDDFTTCIRKASF